MDKDNITKIQYKTDKDKPNLGPLGSSCRLKEKKMLFELVLVIPTYALIFLIYLRLRPLIKAMDDMNDIFADTNDFEDTPKQAAEQRKKRDALKDAIRQGKAHLLGGKKPWTFKRIDSIKDAAINELYYEFQQREMQQKAQNTGKAVGKHVVNLYTQVVSRFFPIKKKQLRQDIGEDPVIEDQTPNLGVFLVRTLGSFLVPVLVAAHTLNNMKDLGFNNEGGHGGDADNKGYKSNEDDEN